MYMRSYQFLKSRHPRFTVSPKLTTATFGPDDRDASAAIRTLFQPTDRKAHGQIINLLRILTVALFPDVVFDVFVNFKYFVQGPLKISDQSVPQSKKNLFGSQERKEGTYDAA
ncbi:hypothetical protein NECAME_06976 [Necator americanus]|uniref:Uncharacterized protein n=1 Tax=Necator americanus TaxID=51031 RepID=W2TT38_NECAM|nr:hypothetical protein NECAME_06976 [Necator americanus]ETN84232.1 hypothetical protein NECAME_06976 [Necator americanus]